MARARRPSIDVQAIKDAASGRWVEILSTLGGISADILDGRHHPCPRCGGTDRFRMVDQDAGALFCNQCHNHNNGDGISGMQWLTGQDFTAALTSVCSHIGIPLPSTNGHGSNGRGRAPRNPDDQLEFQPWVPHIVRYWCEIVKPGTTPEAVQAAGGRIAQYTFATRDQRQTFTVICLPSYSPPFPAAGLSSATPCAWTIWHWRGLDLPKAGHGGAVEYCKMKNTAGSKSGMMMLHGLERIGQPDVEVVWKTGGPTDALALFSIIPPELRDRHIVVANNSGENENPKTAWMELLRGKRVHIVHDADQPGECGALKWVQALAGVAAEVRNIKLPYETTANHGRDIRDYLAESPGHCYCDLLALADQSPPIDPLAAEGAFESRVCSALHLDILGEKPSGEIILFASHPSRRKTDVIKYISDLRYTRLLQIAGPPVQEQVDETGEDDSKFSMPVVKNAIAFLAGRRRFTEESMSGMGVWGGISEHGSESNEVLIVGPGKYGIWDGCTLTTGSHPTAAGRLLDISTSSPWCDFTTLATLLAHCNPASNLATIEEAEAIFSRWNWRHNEEAPTIMTGLTLASFVQTLWEWRPHVAITGDTKTGKTTLFETLDRIFGRLAVRSSRSTAAGLRQALHGTGRVPLCDEFEQSNHRKEILEMIRASSRGDVVIRGTQSHESVQFSLRHIFYVAAIEVMMDRSPDRNRFVNLELIPPTAAKRGKLITPPARQLHNLGQRLLAIAIHSIIEAKSLALTLKSNPIDGIDTRVVESYAVPAAILSVALGYTESDAFDLLRNMLRTAPGEEQQATDQEDILQAIFRATVQLDKGRSLTVASLWAGIEGTDYREALERVGIARVYGRRGYRETVSRESSPERDDGHFLFLDHRDVRSKLLRGTEWESQSIDQILKRIPGAELTRRNLGARRTYGVVIPVSYLEKFLSTKSENEILDGF